MNHLVYGLIDGVEVVLNGDRIFLTEDNYIGEYYVVRDGKVYGNGDHEYKAGTAWLNSVTAR